MSEQERIHVGETADGEDFHLPTVDVLTGRAFLTGKSGAGKSNSTSVVLEELLDAGFAVLVIDQEGEYYGLKEEYELLHAGADEECDIQVSAEHAEKLATLALEENVPVILDVSGYLDEDTADELVRETARHLFVKEKKLKKPFLLVVEECHEYIPEGGGMDETGRMLIKIGKRGRKHGLGIVGVSQRPADVKKDFITQANWLVWHRLTWENDTKVVSRIVGSEYGDAVAELDDGQAFVQADWTDDEVTPVQFKRKRTFDAGATPGLEDFERPDLKSVSDALTDELSEITERAKREESRVAELESELERREARIAELESELETARDVSSAARKMANALAHGAPTAADAGDAADADGASGGPAGAPAGDGSDGGGGGGYQARLRQKDAEIGRLAERVAELEAAIDDLADDADQATLDDLGAVAERDETAAAGVEPGAEADDRPTADSADPDASGAAASAAGGDSANAEGGDGDDGAALADGSRSGGDGYGLGFDLAERFERRPWDVPGGDGAESESDTVDDAMDRLRRRGERLQREETVEAPETDERPGAVEEPEAAEGSEAAETEIGSDASEGAPDPGEPRDGGAPASAADAPNADSSPDPTDLLSLVNEGAVVVRINAARRESNCNDDHAWEIVAALATDAPLTAHDLASRAAISVEAAHSFLAELRSRDLVVRDRERRYRLRADELRALAADDDRTGDLGELRSQWRVD